MSDREDRDLERLIRAALDRQAERVDPRPLFARIMLEVAEPITPVAPTPTRRLPWRRAGLALAASLVALAFVPLVWRDKVALAKGETVVREARKAHGMPIDRCYLVEVRRESSLAAEVAPNLPEVRQTRLWTRGDRFWVESARPDKRWAWGRDEGNRLWMAFGPHSAARFEADEIPDRLNLFFDLYSLNLERWLGDVLDKFVIDREASLADESGSTIRIKARPRQPIAIGPAVQSAELEIDAETRVIRRLVVRRVWNGEPLATVTYSLAETDARDPADYQLEGHLEDPSEVFTRDHEPRRRAELVARWFGNRAPRLLRALEPSARP